MLRLSRSLPIVLVVTGLCILGVPPAVADPCPFDPSDVDTDGDGFCDDGDGSGTVGDNPCDTGAAPGSACDDNCNAIPNVQVDTDDDGQGDLCDLDDGLLYFTEVTAAAQSWGDEAVYDDYNLYRGDLEVLIATGEYTQDPLAVPGAGRFCFVGPTPSFADGYLPDPGETVLYLVSGLPDSGAESSLDGPGAARPNIRPCPGVPESAPIAQEGRDRPVQLLGGCETDGSGSPAPDRQLDAGERVVYRVGFRVPGPPLDPDVEVKLRAVEIDGDSTQDCPPGSVGICTDPDRGNNLPSQDLTITGSPVLLSGVPLDTPLAASFVVEVDDPALSSTVEMLAEITVAGEPAGLLVIRETLDADEMSTFFSTDFPAGGSETRDFNNNELDEAGETIVWSDLSAGVDESGAPVPVNRHLHAPWNFDNNSGGFRSGLSADTDDEAITDLIALWGEDKNFNNRLDGSCQFDTSFACARLGQNDFGNCPFGMGNTFCLNLENRDPSAGRNMDQNWSTNGGCGWQTRAPNTCTGDASLGCHENRDCGRCMYEDFCNIAGKCTGDFVTPCSSDADCILVGGLCGDGRCDIGLDPCEHNGDCTEYVHPFLNPETTRRRILCEVDQDCVDAGLAVPCVYDGPCGLAGQATGGVWHTGTIAAPSAGACASQCELTDVISGTTGQRLWWELLLTPVVQKVNRFLDPATGEPEARVEILNFAWNQSVDLPDENATFTWELDNDLADPLVDLIEDTEVLGSLTGPLGALNGGPTPPDVGQPMFAPVTFDTFLSTNGTVGNNREGQNACVFEAAGAIDQSAFPLLAFAGPPDDDVNNGYCDLGGDTGTACTLVCQNRTSVACDTDATVDECVGTCVPGAGSDVCTNDPSKACLSTAECDFGACVDADPACAGNSCLFDNLLIDEYVKANGPIRNMDISRAGGPDLKLETLEDRIGDSGDRFQGALGFRAVESSTSTQAIAGFGVAIDDPVLEWREIKLVPDNASCAGNECVGDPASGDSDGDVFCDDVDNCPLIFNPDQTDTDQDGAGDACDP